MPTLKPGQVILLENLRFHIEEEGKIKNDKTGESIKADPAKVEQFRASLTRLGDVYVNDAFGTAHRAHSSMVGVQLPQRAAGLPDEEGARRFRPGARRIRNGRCWPSSAGPRWPTRFSSSRTCSTRPTRLIIGGGMAYTFLKVLDGMEIGNSLFDPKGAKTVAEVMEKAQAKGVKIHLPVDFVDCRQVRAKANAHAVVTLEEGIPAGWMGMDCGPQTIKQFRRGDRPGEHDRLERPAGRVRVGQVRRRHAGRDGRGGGGHAAGNGHASSAAATRRRRRPNGSGRQSHPLLHRRRGVAGTARGQDLAGHRGAVGRCEVAAASCAVMSERHR